MEGKHVESAASFSKRRNTKPLPTLLHGYVARPDLQPSGRWCKRGRACLLPRRIDPPGEGRGQAECRAEPLLTRDGEASTVRGVGRVPSRRGPVALVGSRQSHETSRESSWPTRASEAALDAWNGRLGGQSITERESFHFPV